MPSVANAQIMTRMRLTWLAHPGNEAQVLNTFKIILVLVLSALGIDSMLTGIGFAIGWKIPTFVGGTICLGCMLFMLYLVIVTRRHVRHKYEITEDRCNGCEDCCCSFWCGCCTVAQMMRHTADYQSYRGSCCTTTGLPDHAPIV